jgi:hypothetical protein
VLPLIAAVLLAAAAPEATLRLPPVDRCSAEPGVAAFMTQLKAAVVKRDPALLMPLIADDVTVDFGGSYGRDAFKAHWELDKPAESGLWEALTDALSLGCVAAGATLVAPSLSEQIDDPRDPFLLWLAQPGALLKASPSAVAATVATIDWHLVEEDSERNSGDWIAVKLADGRRGFVDSSQLRSPFDYRAVLEKRDGRWLITAFVAGD